MQDLSKFANAGMPISDGAIYSSISQGTPMNDMPATEIPVAPDEAHRLLPDGCPGFESSVFDEITAILSGREPIGEDTAYCDLEGRWWKIMQDEDQRVLVRETAETLEVPQPIVRPLFAVIHEGAYYGPLDADSARRAASGKAREVVPVSTLPEGTEMRYPHTLPPLPSEAFLGNLRVTGTTQPDLYACLLLIHAQLRNPTDRQAVEKATRIIITDIHMRNVEAGWWSDLHTGQRKERNFGELMALAHSEVSEAHEGFSDDLPDDKLPQFPMAVVECADTIIRLSDTAGGLFADDFVVAMGKLVEEGGLLVTLRACGGTDRAMNLIHRDLSNALEAHRKSRSPAYPLASAFLRLIYLGSTLGPLAQAFVAKLAFNRSRADHKPENRRKEGGKII